MEKFYLEKPSLSREKEIISFLNEFAIYNSDLNGAGSLENIFKGSTFKESLDLCLNLENEEYAKSHNKCPGKNFLLIRKNDNKIIGIINIRWNLPVRMQKFGGNIGYSIRPTERKKGYNKINLYLGLLEAQKLGLTNITLDCESTNIASYKTMEALGGKLIIEEIDPFDGILTKVYSFNVDECIKTYKPIYKTYLR